jgi:hypothetical protein
LGDFFAGLELDGRVAEVGHDDLDFAAVPSVDHTSGSGDASGSHRRTVADQQTQRGAGLRVAGFDGDPGANANSLVGFENDGFDSEDIVGEVFARVRDNRETGA